MSNTQPLERIHQELQRKGLVLEPFALSEGSFDEDLPADWEFKMNEFRAREIKPITRGEYVAFFANNEGTRELDDFTNPLPVIYDLSDSLPPAYISDQELAVRSQHSSTVHWFQRAIFPLTYEESRFRPSLLRSLTFYTVELSTIPPDEFFYARTKFGADFVHPETFSLEYRTKNAPDHQTLAFVEGLFGLDREDKLTIDKNRELLARHAEMEQEEYIGYLTDAIVALNQGRRAHF